MVVQTDVADLSAKGMLVHPGDDKPSRIRVEERDGERVRVFARGGELVPDPSGT